VRNAAISPRLWPVLAAVEFNISLGDADPWAASSRPALLAFVAWRPLVEYWRITRSPGGHGTVGLTYSGGALQAALWIAGPPLLIFIAWLATRSRNVERERVRES